ncbi:MAG: hypothetical protein J5822_02600 [Eubacteriaceae bacterium]|nr:hypothetical protein [Eubacteriaceae bacterium]
MDTSKDTSTVKPLEPSFVSPSGLISAAAVFAASYFVFLPGDLSDMLRIILSVSFAAIAEVSASNLAYVKALKSKKPRIFLPEINDVEAVATKDIGAKRRKGGEVAFEYDSMKSVCPAITEGDEAIPAGSRVRILLADSDSTVIVEKA